MNRLVTVALAACLAGCSTSAPGPAVVQDINDQIAKFNSERIPDMGVTPITTRVARVQLADVGGEMICLDQSGNTVVVLKRQPDGSFAGKMRTPYHQLPNLERHSWGEAILDIRIEKKRLQPRTAPYLEPAARSPQG